MQGRRLCSKAPLKRSRRDASTHLERNENCSGNDGMNHLDTVLKHKPYAIRIGPPLIIVFESKDAVLQVRLKIDSALLGERWQV